MNCQQCQNVLDNLLVAQPSAAQRAALAEHAEKCPDCARQYAQARQALAAITPTGQSQVSHDLKERIMAAISDARSLQPVPHADDRFRSRVRVHVSNNHFLERVRNMILAHRRLSVAAAAVTALAAGLILYVFLVSSPSTAYALEQTAEANNHVISYHVKVTPPPTKEGVGEGWVELNPDGTPLRARMEVFGGDRGNRTVIVSKDKTIMWSKRTNIAVVSDNRELIDKAFGECMKMRALFDPKLAFEQLQADEKAGRVQVTTTQPLKEDEPITLTVTFSDDPGRRQAYKVDPKSKLVEQVIEYRNRDNQWKQVSQRDYLDYNKEIDPKVFEPELPKDITAIDLAKMILGKIGLPQGDLTDDQIATKLARECFEALIAGDYQKAGQLNDGIPGEALRKAFEQQQIKILRIVEIGNPTVIHDPRSSVKIMTVPVKVEVERKGRKSIEDKPLRIRRVDKNSDRWSIGGGL